MSPRTPRVIEGTLVVPDGATFAIVASRFNHFIVDRLVEGALDAITRHGGDVARTTIVKVPGAWELPQAARWIAEARGGDASNAPNAPSTSVDAIIALGVVIRGATPHFDYVAGAAATGLAQAAAQSGLPIAFGVLTTDSIEQAVERAGTKAGNKGWDAALTAIEMLSLRRAIGGGAR